MSEELTFAEQLKAGLEETKAILDDMEFCPTCLQLLPEYCKCPKEEV